MIRICCLLICLSGLLNAVELSKDVLKEQKKYNENVTSILKDAEEDLSEAREEFIEDLEKALKVTMRKGDLQGAQAIQDKIKSLQETNMAKLFGEAGTDESDVMAKPEQKEVTIKVLRAFAVPQNGDRRVNITEELQAVVNSGKTKICPAKDLAESTGIQKRAELLFEVETAAGVKRGRCGWLGMVDLETGKRIETNP